MLVDTIQGDMIVEIVDDISAGKPAKFAVHYDKHEHAMIKSNLDFHTIKKCEVSAEDILISFVRRYGAHAAYPKLQEAGFFLGRSTDK